MNEIYTSYIAQHLDVSSNVSPLRLSAKRIPLFLKRPKRLNLHLPQVSPRSKLTSEEGGTMNTHARTFSLPRSLNTYSSRWPPVGYDAMFQCRNAEYAASTFLYKYGWCNCTPYPTVSLAIKRIRTQVKVTTKSNFNQLTNVIASWRYSYI
jgi:hypothetical protein